MESNNEPRENTMKWASIPLFINDINGLVKKGKTEMLNDIFFNATLAAS